MPRQKLQEFTAHYSEKSKRRFMIYNSPSYTIYSYGLFRVCIFFFESNK